MVGTSNFTNNVGHFGSLQAHESHGTRLWFGELLDKIVTLCIFIII